MSTMTQTYRPLGINTPLGPDKLLLTSFTGEERLSGLYHFELELLSEKGGIVAKNLLGQAVSFWVVRQDGTKRWFHGHVASFVYAGANDRAHMYRAHVVPWLWLLSRGSDCRVHVREQPTSSTDVISNLLKSQALTSFRFAVNTPPQKRDYCIQYRETHLDFMSRLLEEDGIFYYIQHEENKSTVVFADNNAAGYTAGDAKVSLLANMSENELFDDLLSWNHQHEFTSGKFASRDYNFEQPDANLLASTSTVTSLIGNSGWEFYDYPGKYDVKGDGDALTKLQMQAEEARHDLVQGSSVCRTFSPGARFKVDKHHVKPEEGKEYMVTWVRHTANLGGSYVTGAGAQNDLYQNEFTAIPFDRPFRPQVLRQKPRIYGVHAAKVVGKSGEEIWTDKYGRVRIQFPWDRNGENNETSSIWVRAMTPWAGNQWGMIQIPRIGQEVVVSFIEGDPDRPVITGMMFNANNMPPYTLPANQTQSGIKTRSSKTGTTENFNELRFEDKKDKEEIYIHAERDLNCVIENNETRKVGFDKKEKGDQSVEIYNDQSLKVGAGSGLGSQTVEIEKDRTVTIKTGNDKLEITAGNQDISLGGGNRTLQIKKGNEEKTLDMGNQTVTLKMGNVTTKADMGAMTFEAMQSIELKVGPSSIKIDASGITIKGGKVTVEGSIMTTVKGPMVEVSGSGMTTVKGGVVMIN